MELVTHKALHFAHDRATVWTAMADVSSYREWWPWLRTFDAQALQTDQLWRCVVKPPLPYTVTFRIAFTRVVERSLVAARVTGDVFGDAELTLTDNADGGCDVVVRSNLEPHSTFLRFLSRTVPAVARYGHDWVLATGARQFEQRALLSVDAPDTTT